MNIYLDCMPCFLRQSLDAARSVSDDARVHEQLVREVLLLAGGINLNRPPPWVGQLIHRRLRELTGVADPYQGAKNRFNQLALSLLPELRARVHDAPRPLLAATKVAIAANVIDLGVKSSLSESDSEDTLRHSFSTDLHGDFAAFERQVNEATSILYLADNAGEMAIDRLLIEVLGPKRITLAVRGYPVLNDATVEDARAAGLHDLVRVISNGSDAPGTILDDCSPEFREEFSKAGLVISKGQGNFETLSDTTANVFFLLKVKCPVVAQHASLPLGAHALLHSRTLHP